MTSVFARTATPIDWDTASFAGGDDPLSFSEMWSKAWQDAPSPEGTTPAENAAEWLTDGDTRRNPGAYVRLGRKAYDQVLLTDLSNSDRLLAERSLDGIISAVERAGGVRLENPLRGGYWREAGGDDPVVLEDGELRRRQLGVFDQKIAQLVESDPRVADAVTAARIDFAPAMIARRAQEDYEAAQVDAPSAIGSLVASFAGGAPAMLRDPVQVGGLFVGGGEVKAATAIGRVLATIGREAGVNAALTALVQPSVQGTRSEMGLDAGIEEALGNVAMAAAVGGAFGGTFRTAGELWRGIRAEDRSLILGAARADIADRAAVEGAPPAFATEEGRKAYADAVSHAEDPLGAPPPELVPELPPARPDLQRVVDEDLPARPGDVETVDGKPVAFNRFDPTSLQTDAAAFQYKGGGDAAGVTDRLRSVTEWDPLASGKTLIFEAEDGTRYVADGHQRLGLAKRIKAADPDQHVVLDGFLFREADGWTRADVRALAAKKNMQEGSGDALDAARVLRDRPDLADGRLPTTAPMMRQALALARLSEDAWGMAVNGAVPPSHAAAVGSTVADPLQHTSILSLLAKAQPETERAARLLIGEALEAGFTAERQIDLFGASDMSRSLLAERVQLLDRAIQDLRKDKSLFGTLAKSADAIEGAGNVLARGTNEARAAAASQLEDILARIARRSGPISDALNGLAARLAEGERIGPLARAFLADVQRIVDERGLAGLLADPELKPAQIVEPGTPDAVRMAEDAGPLLPGLEPENAGQRVPQAAERASQTPILDALDSELTAIGEQTLIPGVAPVTDRQRADAAAARPLTGGDAPAGGLFDETTTKQPDLLDALPLGTREDGGDARLMSRDQALAETDRQGLFGDLVESCKS